MTLVKTGLLCVPHPDEDALLAVRQQLRQMLPGAVILADRSLESNRYRIEELLRSWCDEEELDLILTIGGTWPAPGPSTQEIVPEATRAVLERWMPGLSEAMRAYAVADSPLALLDRGVAGIRGRTLLVNLPAGPTAASLFLEAIADVLPALLASLADPPTLPSLEVADPSNFS